MLMTGVLSSQRKNDSAAGRVMQAARYCQNSMAPISASLLLCSVARVCTFKAAGATADAAAQHSAPQAHVSHHSNESRARLTHFHTEGHPGVLQLQHQPLEAL